MLKDVKYILNYYQIPYKTLYGFYYHELRIGPEVKMPLLEKSTSWKPYYDTLNIIEYIQITYTVLPIIANKMGK